jgi:hypothetical protein
MRGRLVRGRDPEQQRLVKRTCEEVDTHRQCCRNGSDQLRVVDPAAAACWPTTRQSFARGDDRLTNRQEDATVEWTQEWAAVWFAVMPHLLETGRSRTPAQRVDLLNGIAPLLGEAIDAGQSAQFAAELVALPLTAIFSSGQLNGDTDSSEVDRLLSLTPAGRATLRWREAQRASFSGAPRPIAPEIRALLDRMPLGRRTLQDAGAGR